MVILTRLFFIGAIVCGCHGTALDDYVSAPEPDFAWRDTGAKLDLVFGGVAHFLNVTSLRWMDTSKAHGPQGAVWSHQVAVVVPKNLKITNISMAVLTGGCNNDAGNGTGPAFPDSKDEYLVMADTLAAQSGGIAVVVYQLPNCPIVYPSDPEQRGRGEDAMIAWAWLQYVRDPAKDPQWLPRFPMAKAAFQCMKAVTQWSAKNTIADIEGWVVSGASKRGWTTWMVGAATCESCEKIVGIVPLVPIVPNLVAEVHRQWKSYGGFTFAFADYMAVNLTEYLDGPEFSSALQLVDPMYYKDRLSRLPKVVVLSSDDEFMQFDWSDIWYDDLTGEKHLLIVPNSEHSLATGIPEVIECAAAFFKNIAHGGVARPTFDYTFDNSTGKISVTIPAQFDTSKTKVVLRHTHTHSTQRRDFRWIRQANDHTENCTLPEIKLKKPTSEGGGNCVVPIIWLGTTLKPDPSSPHVYSATPPEPPKGHWTGYYVEVFFPTDALTTEWQFTTPGFAYPNTLPFPDCHGKGCVGRPV